MPKFNFNLKSFYDRIRNNPLVTKDERFVDIYIINMNPFLKHSNLYDLLKYYLDDKYDDLHAFHKYTKFTLKLHVNNIGNGNYEYELLINGFSSNKDNGMLTAYIATAGSDGKIRCKRDRIIAYKLSKHLILSKED